jgi:2-oxoisovalerate dehydrogenase E1 component
MERAFDDLDAPVQRLNGAFVPTPSSPSLVSAVVPDPASIARAVRDLVAA